MLRVLIGRHRSASSWSRIVLRDISRALKLDVLTIFAEEQYADYSSLGEMVRVKRPDCLVLTNAIRSHVETLPPDARVVHLFRDPRDIVASGYFSHRNDHPVEIDGVKWPELVGHRENLLQLDRDSGMMAEIEFSGYFLDHMLEWNWGAPGVHEVKMEDLVADSIPQWRRILEFWELAPDDSKRDTLRRAICTWNLAKWRNTPKSLVTLRKVLPRLPLDQLPAGYVEEAVDFFNFTRLSQGRKIGDENENHHYRKGIPGDWRNHLNEDHLKLFRKRYGDLVERMGYEW